MLQKKKISPSTFKFPIEIMTLIAYWYPKSKSTC